MELRDYLKILARHRILVWGVAVLAVALVLIYDFSQPIEYHGSLTLMVLNKAEETDEYKYDNYYNVQAASGLAKSMESWFHSPDNVSRIFQEAGTALPTKDMKKLQNIFDARRYNPDSSLLVVRLSSSNQTDLQKTLERAGQNIQTKFKDWQEKQALAENFYLDVEGPTVLVQPQNYLFDAVLGVVLGIILGGIAAFIKEYLISN